MSADAGYYPDELAFPTSEYQRRLNTLRKHMDAAGVDVLLVTTCINILRSSKPQTELTVSDLNEDETAWLENKLSKAASAKHQTEEDK